MRKRRLIAVVCIVVVLAAAMAPWSSLTGLTGASLGAILVPLPHLFGALVSAPLPEPRRVPFPSTFTAAPLPSRAPPAA